MSDDNGNAVEPWRPPGWTSWGREPNPGDPYDTPYAWVSDEVSEELNKINLGDTRKRRTTILMMADAVASGTREIYDVLADDLTLGHAGWYTRIRTDPDFDQVYQFCLGKAQAWYDHLDGRRLFKRAMREQRSKDELVSLTEQAVRVMADLLRDEDVAASIRRQIAIDILDRASEETAMQVSATLRPGAQGGPTMRELRSNRPRPIEQISSGSMSSPGDEGMGSDTVLASDNGDGQPAREASPVEPEGD